MHSDGITNIITFKMLVLALVKRSLKIKVYLERLFVLLNVLSCDLEMKDIAGLLDFFPRPVEGGAEQSAGAGRAHKLTVSLLLQFVFDPLGFWK